MLKASILSALPTAAILLSATAFADSSSLTEQVNALWQAKDYQAAQQLLAGKVDRKTKDAELLALLGQTEALLDNKEEAEGLLEKALKYNAEHADYQHWYATVSCNLASSASMFSAMGYAKRCRQAYEKALDLAPQNPRSYIALGSFYAQAPGIAGGDKAKAIVERLAQSDQDTKLIGSVIRLWDIIGVDQEDKGENSIILRPSEHMMFPTYPGLHEDGVTVTFDRDTALSRDDIALITQEHPLVQTGLDLITSSDTGTTSVAILKNKALPAGTLFLELIYMADASAPKSSQLYRYLPPTPIRILLDKNGNDLSAKVDYTSFDKQLSAVNRHIGSKLVTASQPILHPLFAKGEEYAQVAVNELVAQAREKMTSQLTGELERLESLKAVNPNIREEELEYLRNQMRELTTYLDASQLQLDAIRMVLVSHV